MKTGYKKYIVIIGILFIAITTSAQVGIGTTNPDASAMLDIQSTAKGVLIPRMTTAQREAISTPATGLLVFDNTTQSFWFYSGSWQELTNSSSGIAKLVDTDNDTKIEVEQSADEDKIRFSTLNGEGASDASVERMSIDKLGNTRIGDGTNNTYIESDGSLSYEGSATRWDDLKVPVFSTNRDGTKPPGLYWFQDLSGGGGSGSQGVFAYWFDQAQEEEVYFMVQMPHGWKEGTDIYPHVHWSTKNNLGAAKVQWGLEYTWANVGDITGATTIITGNAIIASCNGYAYEHMITTLPTISGSGKTLSSMILCRLYRDADDSSDNYGYDAGLFEIDFHYQIDADGSREQYVK